MGGPFDFPDVLESTSNLSVPPNFGAHQNHHDQNLLDHRNQRAPVTRVFTLFERFNLWPTMSEGHNRLGLQSDDWSCIHEKCQRLGANRNR